MLRHAHEPTFIYKEIPRWHGRRRREDEHVVRQIGSWQLGGVWLHRRTPVVQPWCTRFTRAVEPASPQFHPCFSQVPLCHVPGVFGEGSAGLPAGTGYDQPTLPFSDN